MTDNHSPLAAQQAAGLRQLADMIEDNPGIAPLAKTYLSTLHVFYAWTTEDVQTIIRAAKAAGAQVGKSFADDYFIGTLTWGPINAHVVGGRELVCEKNDETTAVVAS